MAHAGWIRNFHNGNLLATRAGRRRQGGMTGNGMGSTMRTAMVSAARVTEIDATHLAEPVFIRVEAALRCDVMDSAL
jgi:hypothetical protein